jgi:sporulation protein YlmC with PRC-barrel domain
MAKTTPVTIGADVSCTDGACGKVSRVVIDPAARAITHLVVDRNDQGQLVPLALVDAATGGIRLRCTIAEFENLDPADKTVLQDSGDSRRDRDVLGLSRGSGVGPSSVTWDTLPFGEVAVRGGEHVHGTDGDIGQVQGLVMDPGSGQVTHVLLQEGHVFGRKVVAIPIGAVTDVGQDGIQFNITRQHVQNLPPADIDHPGR